MENLTLDPQTEGKEIFLERYDVIAVVLVDFPYFFFVVTLKV